MTSVPTSLREQLANAIDQTTEEHYGPAAVAAGGIDRSYTAILRDAILALGDVLYLCDCGRWSHDRGYIERTHTDPSTKDVCRRGPPDRVLVLDHPETP